ncbi:unnamed protein product [Dracunculus medinensis]|uniref:Telomerase reverse transcriptase n=1 Tax=Dracunculus medinensis TaxID=318479 RepID=A0A0N4U7K9_DRAME|nr:unnamed protein product [Dracunculus medinensis]
MRSFNDEMNKKDIFVRLLSAVLDLAIFVTKASFYVTDMRNSNALFFYSKVVWKQIENHGFSELKKLLKLSETEKEGQTSFHLDENDAKCSIFNVRFIPSGNKVRAIMVPSNSRTYKHQKERRFFEDLFSKYAKQNRKKKIYSVRTDLRQCFDHMDHVLLKGIISNIIDCERLPIVEKCTQPVAFLEQILNGIDNYNMVADPLKTVINFKSNLNYPFKFIHMNGYITWNGYDIFPAVLKISASQSNSKTSVVPPFKLYLSSYEKRLTIRKIVRAAVSQRYFILVRLSFGIWKTVVLKKLSWIAYDLYIQPLAKKLNLNPKAYWNRLFMKHIRKWIQQGFKQKSNPKLTYLFNL